MDVLSILLATPLFAGFSEAETAQLLAQLKPQRRLYQKGEFLLMHGYENHDIFILLRGHVEATKVTRGGRPFLLAHMGQGDILGDVLAGSHTQSPVTVCALEPCEALLFHYPGLLQGKGVTPALHSRLLANLVALIAGKYFALDARIDLLLIKSLRRRIAAFLLGEAKAQGGNALRYTHTRAQLANYLGCERSALSRELSRMAREGLIALEKKGFVLLQPEALRALP